MEKELALLFNETINKCVKDRKHSVKILGTIVKQYKQAVEDNDDESKVIASLAVAGLGKILTEFGL